MNDFIAVIINNLYQILTTTLVGIVSYVMASVGLKIKKIIDDKRVKAFIEDTVRYVNQAYGALSNEEKFQEAKKEILEWLTEEGLKITNSKLTVLIESAVNMVKFNK